MVEILHIDHEKHFTIDYIKYSNKSGEYCLMARQTLGGWNYNRVFSLPCIMVTLLCCSISGNSQSILW